MRVKSPRARVPWLVIFPLLFLCFFVYFNIVSSNHAPDWHTGLYRARSVARTPSSPFRHLTDLEAGTHFTADYPTDGFVDPENPGLDEEGGLGLPSPTAEGGGPPPPLFHYITGSGNTSSNFPFVWLSKHPRIAYFPEFLSEEECDAIINEANDKVARSSVVPTGGASSVQDVRTSSHTFLPTDSGAPKPIVDRIIKLLGFSHASSEQLQVLRYNIGQKYDAHNDYLDPVMYGPQKTQRAATMFLYLSDVESGGETWFPSASSQPLLTTGFNKCSGGLMVKPKKRAAALFYDMKPSGALDPQALHGSCPVKTGIKWGGTLWLRVPTPG